MPRIDPCQLLKCLKVLLSNGGGIKSKDEVNRMANLMTKFSKKLVSKCIYILILKSTEVDIMDMFMSAGGWDLVFSWLSDGIAAKNWPLVEELVELLLICPVTIDRLKGNNCPKVIKLLSKDNSATEKVKQLACGVVEQWLSIVREATGRPAYEQPEGVEVGRVQLDEENREGEVIAEPKGDDQLPIYKITIRDGPQVLAQVISDKSGSRVDTGSAPVQQEEDVTEEGKEPTAVAKPKRRQTSVLSSSPSDSEEDSNDEDWSQSKTAKPTKAGKKRQAPQKNRSLSLSKKRKGKAGGTEDKSILSTTPKVAVAAAAITKKGAESRVSQEWTKGKQEETDIDKEEVKHRTEESRSSKIIEAKLKEEKKLKDSKTKEERKQQADKDRATLAKLVTPSISSMGRIPKKNKEGTKEEKKDKKEEVPRNEKKPEKKPVEPPKPLPKDPKKYNYTTSVEIRKRDTLERPKTIVKTFNSKFRSTGLEEAAPLPKTLKKSDKKDEIKKVSKRLSPPPKDEIPSPVPEKKFKEEEKDKKVLTPPKPKLMHLQESDMFADALTAANTFKDVKKKKRRTSLSEMKKEKEGSPPKSDEKKTEPAKPKFKFYQETLITSDEIKTEEEDDVKRSLEADLKEEGSSSPVTAKEIEDELEKTEEAISNFVKSEEKKNVEREKCRLATGILVYVKKNRHAKKIVHWGVGDAIQEVRYFELDETERVNVTKTFLDMKAMERTNEREQIMLSRKIAANDLMEEKTRWRPLIPVEVLGEYIDHGKNSLEKDIQYTRERTVAPSLYFNKKMIPDSPAEPDLEIHAQTEPILIPLTDTTGNPDSLISYKDKGWPEPKESPPPSENVNNGVVEPVIEHMIVERHPPMMVGPGVGPPMMDFRPGQPMGPGFFPGNMGPPGMMPPAGPPMGNWMGGGQPSDMMPMNQDMMPINPMMGMGMGPPNDMQFQGMPPNMNPGFMPRQPQMNFSPQHQFAPQEPRPNRPWYRPNAPHQQSGGGGGGGGGGQWRHPSKGNNWGKKNRTCINIIKRGFCKTPHCAFKHPPPYSNHH